MSGVAEAQGLVRQIRSSFDYEALLEAYNANETQLSRGETHLDTVFAMFPQVAFGARNSNCSCQVEGLVRQPAMTFFFPRVGHPRFLSEASFDSEGQCYLISTDHFRVVFPENYQHEFVSIKEANLPFFFNEEDQEEFIGLAGKIHKRHCPAKSREQFLQDLHMSIDVFRSQQEILQNKLIVKDISARLVYSLFEYLQAYSTDSGAQRAQKIKSGLRYNIIRRTLRFIESQDISKLSIAEIARAACVSIRTLEYAFTSILNMTPKQYLITLRLNAIRRELEGSLPGTTIKSILARYGVVNQGRFSCDYYKLFGQKPSHARQENQARQRNKLRSI